MPAKGDSDNTPAWFLRHLDYVCVSVCVCHTYACMLCACVLFITRIPVSNKHEFPKCCSDHGYCPENIALACVFVCVGVTCSKLLSVMVVEVFWMCPSHLVTIAETDRGVVGQSGVGVLNELS